MSTTISKFFPNFDFLQLRPRELKNFLSRGGAPGPPKSRLLSLPI
jgi:hypothetical protein